MKNKTYRFAAALAVLLALLVFVAPVGAADTDIIKVGVGQTNATWSAAVANATDSDGDGAITYEIYGKVEVDKTGWVSPRGTSGATTINFVGKTDDAELCIPTASLTVIATDGVSNMKAITFTDLICSRTAGAWVGDIGHANNYFTALMRGASKEATVTYTNCHFPNGTCNNQYGTTVYTECTFNNPTEYALWIYYGSGSTGDVTVTGGTFDAKKGVKVYAEGANAKVPFTTTTKITGATFDIEDKPAIVSSVGGTVIIEGVDASACQYGLLEVKAEFADDTIASVTVDGKEPVYFKGYDGNYKVDAYYTNLDYAKNASSIDVITPVAKVGDKKYFSLDDAIAEVAENGVITLQADVDVDTGVIIEKSLTITSEAGQKYSISNDRAVTGNEGAAIVVNKDDVTLKLDNVIVNADHYAIRIWNKSNVQITNSEVNGWSALYFKEGSEKSEVTVSKSTLTGTNNMNPPSNDFGTIVFEDSNVTVTVEDSIVKAIANTASNQSIVMFSDWYSPNSDDTVTFTGGELILTKGTSASLFVSTDIASVHDVVTIGEGVTANFNPSAYIASGMEVVQPGDKYLVQKYVDRSSSSSSSSTTEPEEPEQPEEPVVDPEVPTEEPVAGEATVETEVTDGGEVELETPAAEGEGGSAAADEDEAKITGVVLPTGTDSEVTFVPVSEQPAPAGQEENTKKVFEINVPTYEKGKPAVIKFQMTVEELAADGKEAADVALWHFDEETGEWTKLVTSYTIVDGVVYFEAITEDFSPFAIIYEDEPADEPVEEPETPASPAPVLGLLAALGAAVVLRRK